MNIDFEWTHGIRLGLWYHDFSDRDEWPDTPFNFCIVLDLGIFSVRFWSDLRGEYREVDEFDE